MQTWAGGYRELESFGKATLHGQGRALEYTSRSLGHCGLVMEGPAREDGSGTRSSRRSARAGEARVSRAVATLSGVAGRKKESLAGSRQSEGSRYLLQ